MKEKSNESGKGYSEKAAGEKAAGKDTGEKAAAAGKTVTVDYKGTFDDGTVFDTSEGKAPLVFELGSGYVIKGFDDAITGMRAEETKNITIKPGEAYGERDELLVQKVPLGNFPPGMSLKVGSTFILQAPTGQKLITTVTSVDSETATIDFNHPLAGKTLHFGLRLISIS